MLAGVAGALLAFALRSGQDLLEAVCAAVYVHGRAADRIAEGRDRGILASEIADAVSFALSEIVTPEP